MYIVCGGLSINKLLKKKKLKHERIFVYNKYANCLISENT